MSTLAMVFGLLHLRVHEPYMVAEARKAQPGGKRPKSVYAGHSLWRAEYRGGESRGMRRLRVVRIARVACDGGFARWDETAAPRKALFTCSTSARVHELFAAGEARCIGARATKYSGEPARVFVLRDAPEGFER